jgi:acyl-[acyl-carrier-protein]-phospholipid O-acyltransferase / long-chain-fatty-acid--[acyl-carrier-protein] ligase
MSISNPASLLYYRPQSSQGVLSVPGGTYSHTFRLPGFQAFLWTQFLGAFNDNVYKMIVSLLAVDMAVRTGGGSGYLTLVGLIFMLPFLFFSGYAGHLADVFSKRSVLVVTKAFEIIAMALAVLAFWSARIEWMLGVVFLMALQSTFFSPAKYGILPEMIPNKDLSRANGLLEMSTFLAIILGTSLGGAMAAAWKAQPGWIGFVLVMIAIAGTVTSFGIPKVPPSGIRKPFQLNPWAEIASGLQRLHADKTLWLTVLGIAYFWFVGALLQMDVILFGKEILALDDFRIALLGMFLGIGIGLGSLAAGRLSGDKVELGLVPLGSIGLGIFALLLSSLAPSYTAAATALCLIGFSGGLFIVPLNALLQQRSGGQEKGQLIATANLLSTGGILLASGVLWLLRDLLDVASDRILLVLGLLTLAATVYILGILPDFLIRFTLWLLAHTFYKIRIVGQEHVPFRGPALLVCNHVSHVDGFVVGACVQRFIRFMIYRPYYELKPFHRLFQLMAAIPVSGRSRKEVVESIDLARAALDQGHVVCIFAEGAISRTGNLLPFKRGFEKIVEGRDVPVIPVCLDRLWGSIFSFKNGRFFWKRPEHIPYPVTVVFGKPLPHGATAQEARQAILELSGEAARHRRTPSDLLHLQFIRTAKRRWFSFCMTDSTGKKLTYGSALTASLLLARRLDTGDVKENMVGILLPASVTAALANIAVLLAGKIPVNLNFTAGKEALASAIEQCMMRTILTSRVFLAKAKVAELPGMIFLEDLMKGIGTREKATTALRALLVPSYFLKAQHASGHADPDSLATVIFSSGSTGAPKGVMLSHHSILSNIEAMAQLFWVTKKDRMMGVLPFFHSFGFTATLWFPLAAGFGVVYHSNPADAKNIGELTAQHKGTILISTPTFYGLYSRQCAPEQFASLRYAIVGAEKLSETAAAAFREKFSLDLLEGYGCTEMGPVVAVNVPDIQEGREIQRGHKPGTVGHPIPGVAAKVVDPETHEPVGNGEDGLLLVKGPNRMLGYLGEPEKTREVLRDGWYVTGDIATIDEDGFIRITDRLARFSKIGGEMVPHIKVEEAINRILGVGVCAVVAIPDERKGEQLVVLYAHKETEPEQLWHALQHTDLPRLWIPKRENMHYVEAIPVLGTGKLDIQKARTIAMEKFGK